jgi:hypothetical protein
MHGGRRKAMHGSYQSAAIGDIFKGSDEEFAWQA